MIISSISFFLYYCLIGNQGKNVWKKYQYEKTMVIGYWNNYRVYDLDRILVLQIIDDSFAH